jgi:predicted mannosyl-3-phosphoglycerate phosphatase (HAD superfamily)
LRSSTTVVYCAVDNLISYTGKPLTGFAGFLESLADSNIPSIWITSRTRSQLDTILRRFGHSEPFIAEGGSGVYLPEDYFHLKPAHTVRMARFTCIPVATPQPAAAEALDQVAAETGVSIVPLRSLSPRELSQNTGLAQREAELLRLRDFDELFFFAGASDSDIQGFREAADQRRLLLRKRGAFWSLAVGANLATCVRELSKLYERAMRAQPFKVGIATTDEASELLPLCERPILLTDRPASPSPVPAGRCATPKSFPLFSEESWDGVLEAIQVRRP